MRSNSPRSETSSTLEVHPAPTSTPHLADAVLAKLSTPLWIFDVAAIRSLIGDGTLLAIATFTLLGLLMGHLLGGPDAEDRTVLALAAASRHPAVALAIASASFPEQKLVLPAVLLALLTGIVATVPYSAWRKRVHAAWPETLA